MPKPAKRYATLTDAALQRLVAQDDTHAQPELQARQYVHLLTTQAKTPADPRDFMGAFVLDERVYGYYLTDDLFVQFRRVDDKVTMWLRMDAQTTQERIKEAWADIAGWRDRLAAWQPPDDGRDRYLAQLSWAHKHKSYAALAYQINAEIAEHLTRAWADWQAERQAQQRGEPLGPWRNRTGRFWQLSLYAAHFPMQALGMQPSDIGLWTEKGVENLQQGLPPFRPDEPIGAVRVREALRYWVKPDPEWLDHPSR